MKKASLFLVVTIVANILLLSCKKNDTPAPITITGYWRGNIDGSPLGIIFYKNGYLKSSNSNLVDTTALTGQAGGTYTFSDSTVLLTFDYIGPSMTYHFTGVCKTNKEGTLMTGRCSDGVTNRLIALGKLY